MKADEGRDRGMVTPVEHHDKRRQKLLIFRTFQVHQLSWVGYLAPATFVPTFAVRHFGRATQLDELQTVLCRRNKNIFLRKFGDENTTRNIM